MNEFILAGFGILLSSLGTILIMYFKEIKTDVKSMAESIVQLNLKLEKVISDQTWHKEELVEIKERIDKIESKE